MTTVDPHTRTKWECVADMIGAPLIILALLGGFTLTDLAKAERIKAEHACASAPVRP